VSEIYLALFFSTSLIGKRQVVGPCYRTCKAWRRELEARGFCRRTWQLCSTMAGNTPDATVEQSSAVAHMASHLTRVALLHVDARECTAERAACLDANALLQTAWGCVPTSP